jgi:hypothetical protein
VPTGEQIVIGPKPGAADPVRHRLAGLLSEFDLHWTLGLLSHDDRPGTNTIAMRNVWDTQPDQIASAQLAVAIACDEAQQALRQCIGRTLVTTPDASADLPFRFPDAFRIAVPILQLDERATIHHGLISRVGGGCLSCIEGYGLIVMLFHDFPSVE